MSLLKSAQKKRPEKSSHFRYTTAEARQLGDAGRSFSQKQRQHSEERGLVRVRPGQPPLLRALPGELQRQLGESSEGSEAGAELRISDGSRRHLQEIIEAQKCFLKYQEVRAALEAGQAGPAPGAVSRADSDKENSVGQELNGERRRKKRKSETGGGVEEPGGKRSAMTSPVLGLGSVRVTQEVQTQTTAPPQQQQGEAELECDWAYWYRPGSEVVQPARVTIRSRNTGLTSQQQTKKVRMVVMWHLTFICAELKRRQSG